MIHSSLHIPWKAQRVHYFVKYRCVNVAMKLISIIRPMMASRAANTVMGLSSGIPPGKKPRPWNEVMLKMSAASGEKDGWTVCPRSA